MEHSRDDGKDQDVEGLERRNADRRSANRRHDASLGGRRHDLDRRRRDRRLQLTAVGLLAGLSFTVGARHVTDPWPGLLPADSIDWAPDARVDIAEQFRVPVWNKETLEPIIQEAAALHGMPAALIRAVIQTESQFNPTAVSRVGAQGLMQLMPKTARHLGVENPLDPRENVLGGTKYLSTLLQRFGGNTARALAAYNAGPTTVSRYRGIPPYRETQGYVRKIHKLVGDTDAAFAMPAQKVRKASLRSKSRASKVSRARVSKSKARRSAVSRRAASKAKVSAARKASSRRASVRKAPVKKTSVRKATTRRAARRG